MSTPPANIAESIRNLTTALHGFCEFYAKEVPAFLPNLLDSFDAELARWRQKVQPGAPGDTTTTDR